MFHAYMVPLWHRLVNGVSVLATVSETVSERIEK
jgi:hypothetical protein